jgi:hypothetical protein
MKRKRLRGVLHAYYDFETLAPGFQEECYTEKNFHFGYCRKCGKSTGENPIKLRLHRIDGNGKLVEECPNNAHEEYVDTRFDLEKMYFLQVGDCLTIFSKEYPSQKLWSGVIRSSLPKNAVDYKEPFLDECIPAGIPKSEWFKWFSEEYPATILLRLK